MHWYIGVEVTAEHQMQQLQMEMDPRQSANFETKHIYISKIEYGEHAEGLPTAAANHEVQPGCSLGANMMA